MFKEASRPAVLPEPRPLPFLKIGSSAGVWLTGLCVLAYWTVFLWASGKGYDFSDEAFQLLSISDPRAYRFGDTDFGWIWHPLYVALDGSIAGLRIGGLAALTMCATLFGIAALRFAHGAIKFDAARITIILGIAASVAWQYQGWRATPNYNILNLCALLLLFAGLFDAARLDRNLHTAIYDRATIGRAALCAVGIDLMVLTKATTAVIAIPVGIVALLLLRKRHAQYFIALTAGIAALFLVIWIMVIDGGFAAFMNSKLRTLGYLRTSNGDVHGIAASVSGAFSKKWIDVLGASSFAAILFVLGLIWSCLLVPPRNKRAGLQWAAYIVAAIMGFLVFWWRDQDLQLMQSFRGFRLWRLPLLFVLLAFTFRILWLTKFDIDSQRMRIFIAAAILAIMPVAYAFGSEALIVWKVADAGIFWAGAMILLGAMVPIADRDHLLPAIAFLCGATSLGLLIGTMELPGRIGAPVWGQTVAVTLGPQLSRVSVNSAAADYIGSFRRDARLNGFGMEAPVLDLSEVGPGLTFALGGKPVAATSWLFGYGDVSDESQRRAILGSEVHAVMRELVDVPDATLRRAWIITGAPAYSGVVRMVLTSRGIKFPERYRLVSRNSRSDLAWTQSLWKPVD